MARVLDYLFSRLLILLYNVSFDINDIQEEAVWDGVLQADSKWAYARENSAKKQMRTCYEDVTSGDNSRAEEHATFLNDKFSEERVYSQFVESVVSVLGESEEQSDDAQVIVL